MNSKEIRRRATACVRENAKVDSNGYKSMSLGEISDETGIDEEELASAINVDPVQIHEVVKE